MLDIDDDIARRLREIGRRSGRALSEIVSDVLRRALSDEPRSPDRPFVVETFDGGVVPTGVEGSLNKLVDDLEIEDFLGEQEA